MNSQTFSVEHEGFTYISHNGEFYKGCLRCQATGHYSFDGSSSVCYSCGNKDSMRLGHKFNDEEEARKWCHERAMRRKRTGTKRLQQEEARRAEVAANQRMLKEAAPDVYEFLMGIKIEPDTQDQYETYEDWANAVRNTEHELEKNTFLRSMAETLRWVRGNRPFTDRMIVAVRNAMNQKDAQQAEIDAADPIVDGRQVITGEIVSASVRETQYGTQHKITIKEDRGFKVYVSIPSNQATEALENFHEWADANGHPHYMFGPSCWFLGTDDGSYPGVRGSRITMTAALVASGDNPKFGFGSRPTRGAWLTKPPTGK